MCVCVCVFNYILDSFFFRWGMNTNKCQLNYVNTFEQFNKMMADATKNVSILTYVLFDVILYLYQFFSADLPIFFFFLFFFRSKTSFCPRQRWLLFSGKRPKSLLIRTPLPTSSSRLSWQLGLRLELYSEMDELGRSVLYHDTDSIVYASNGINDSPFGNFLGEFTDELDGDTITTFISGKYFF